MTDSLLIYDLNDELLRPVRHLIHFFNASRLELIEQFREQHDDGPVVLNFWEDCKHVVVYICAHKGFPNFIVVRQYQVVILNELVKLHCRLVEDRLYYSHQPFVHYVLTPILLRYLFSLFLFEDWVFNEGLYFWNDWQIPLRLNGRLFGTLLLSVDQELWDGTLGFLRFILAWVLLIRFCQAVLLDVDLAHTLLKVDLGVLFSCRLESCLHNKLEFWLVNRLPDHHDYIKYHPFVREQLPIGSMG